MFSSLVRFLRTNLPADRPVKVRRTRVPRDVQGDCLRQANCFRIRIDKDLGEPHQIDVLLHEYGHTLVYEPQHGAAWGKAYARVYRAYLAWVEWLNGPSVAGAVPCRARSSTRQRRDSQRRPRRRR
jgi:hypothetical protein